MAVARTAFVVAPPSATIRSSSIAAHTRRRDSGVALKPTGEDGGWYSWQQLQTANGIAYSSRKGEKKMQGSIPVLAQKRANLVVKSGRLVELPEWATSAGPSRSFGSFLHNSEGMESVLNTKSLESMEPLGENLYRCTLPQMEFMDLQVAPVLDLYVAATESDCIVEMRSCKFLGSKELERQNDRFSASMKNHLKWDANRTLNVEVELRLSLEIYTFPFKHLPASAVEVPGHAILQACLDRMMPTFVSYLLEDYRRWAEKEESLNHPQQQLPRLALHQGKASINNGLLAYDQISHLTLSTGDTD